MVQESCLRAYSFLDSLRAVDPRPWLLSIVRNTGYTMLRRERAGNCTSSLNEDMHEAAPEHSNPELLRERAANHDLLRHALDRLPPEYREILVLRELEDLSYKEISETTGIPMGTVMSRLSRARQRLQNILLEQREEGVV